jgi:hypothetical protein
VAAADAVADAIPGAAQVIGVRHAPGVVGETEAAALAPPASGVG